jgi:hypothetical protein
MPLPLDPIYEAAQRALWDQLQAALMGVQTARPELMGQNELLMQRLGTNQGIDTRQLNASLAGHGIFNSGIRTVQTDRLGTQYDRQRQDATFDLAHALSGLSQQAGGARMDYTRGLQEAQLDLARRQAADPYAVLPKYGPNQHQHRPGPPGKPPVNPFHPPNRRRR